MAAVLRELRGDRDGHVRRRVVLEEEACVAVPVPVARLGAHGDTLREATLLGVEVAHVVERDLGGRVRVLDREGSELAEDTRDVPDDLVHVDVVAVWRVAVAEGALLVAVVEERAFEVGVERDHGALLDFGAERHLEAERVLAQAEGHRGVRRSALDLRKVGVRPVVDVDDPVLVLPDGYVVLIGTDHDGLVGGLVDVEVEARGRPRTLR